MAYTETCRPDGLMTRHYLPCQHPEAFTHRPAPKGKGAVKAVFASPTMHKAFWAAMWETIKAQPWYEADVGMVMVGDDGYAYCQYPGQTTGFARVHVGLPHGANTDA